MQRALRPGGLRQARARGREHAGRDVERTELRLGIARPQIRQSVAGTAAGVEHPRRRDAHEVEPRQQAVAHLALQHRMRVIVGRRAVERAPHLGKIERLNRCGHHVCSLPHWGRIGVRARCGHHVRSLPRLRERVGARAAVNFISHARNPQLPQPRHQDATDAARARHAQSRRAAPAAAPRPSTRPRQAG